MSPHHVFFSPPGTMFATSEGVRKNKMNHLRLFAYQNALRPRNRTNPGVGVEAEGVVTVSDIPAP
jgi:hypothetical protein